MERRQAVRALILSDADDSVLLLRMQRPDRPGNFWLLPGGGVKPNEDRLDALRREVREETDLALRGSPRLLWRRVHRFRRGHGEHNRVTEAARGHLPGAHTALRANGLQQPGAQRSGNLPRVPLVDGWGDEDCGCRTPVRPQGFATPGGRTRRGRTAARTVVAGRIG